LIETANNLNDILSSDLTFAILPQQMRVIHSLPNPLFLVKPSDTCF